MNTDKLSSNTVDVFRSEDNPMKLTLYIVTMDI